MELEYERLRREEVESQTDQLRKQLQQQTLSLELSQDMLQTVSSNILHGTMELSIKGTPHNTLLIKDKGYIEPFTENSYKCKMFVCLK